VDLLNKILPWIGAAATGNVPMLVGMAAKTVGDVLGVEVDAAQPNAVQAAIAQATPEQLVALKQADHDFMVKMQAMGFAHAEELAKIATADTQNARQREISTGDSLTPRILAGLVVVGWLVVQGFLLTNVIDPTMRELIARVLGTLDAALTLVLSYYFGSSAGSKAKTQLMADRG
jgi:hypothetical protein